MDIELRPGNEDPLVNSIKVSSAAIQIIRPKSQANTPLAKRHLLLPRNNKSISNPSGAQVIVTKYFESWFHIEYAWKLLLEINYFYGFKKITLFYRYLDNKIQKCFEKK